MILKKRSLARNIKSPNSKRNEYENASWY
ncbi:hypothetical protein E2C01_004698 [Portunus trituberculatus]|uniref:Uncharacterized protein n=1 Tax=Portunus trituberculatus TaxID=210409 RepID=A0A5B7CT06_PORTR|nr:hypothetical protein [Portunus trituberculatus]